MKKGVSTLPVWFSSQEAYLAAIAFEAQHGPDPTGKEPSGAKRYQVAKHVLGLLKNKDATQKGGGHYPWLASPSSLPAQRCAAATGSA